MMFACIIDGEPVAKGRPKHTKRGFAYTPAKTRMAEAKAAKAISQLWRDGVKLPTQIEGPVTMRAVFFMQIPKSASKKRKAELDGKPCLKKPDIDNLLKLLCDAINATGIWNDDAQVFRVEAEMKWSNEPRTHLELEW